MLRLFRRVDGDRHPFHQSWKDLLMLAPLKENGTENHQGLLRDEVRLRRLGVVLLDQRDEQQIRDEQHLDGCPPLVDARLDGSDDLQVGAGLLPRRLKRMDCYLREVGAGLHLQLEQDLE